MACTQVRDNALLEPARGAADDAQVAALTLALTLTHNPNPNP